MTRDKAIKRRLWERGNHQIPLNSKVQDTKKETYDEIFTKFATKSPQMPLSLLTARGLIVGQEFILTCLLLASHRVALDDENKSPEYQPISNILSTFQPTTQPYVLFVPWVSFLLTTAIFSRISPDSASITQKEKLQTRGADSLFMALFLRFLAGVLQTLTASYSSDTVHALAIGGLVLHLLACDFDYANGHTESNGVDTTGRPPFKGGTLSLTAAFFSTILLASRLEENVSVYIFVTYSVILFALYPAARHRVAIATKSKYRAVPFAMTLQLVFMTFLLLSTYEAIFAGAVFVTLCLLVPGWVYTLQSSKTQLRGPWDIAHVS
ncbi:unnamed protein product [Cylindrotheca closterium]|uniref:Phosphatidylinositol N-acetylglucosaminyltransferase n=1 Tax=Cylindrotheca closterium TaxID=2856 RepID=A0AAD2CBN8_9STRA|nr:unnamed protein product [Cylindrotheca closterium]